MGARLPLINASARRRGPHVESHARCGATGQARRLLSADSLSSLSCSNGGMGLLAAQCRRVFRGGVVASGALILRMREPLDSHVAPALEPWALWTIVREKVAGGVAYAGRLLRACARSFFAPTRPGRASLSRRFACCSAVSHGLGREAPFSRLSARQYRMMRLQGRVVVTKGWELARFRRSRWSGLSPFACA